MDIFVANHGLDTNDGSIEFPYKTLAKIQALSSTLQPGDRVLFNRGDIFKGRLQFYLKDGEFDNPIKIDSYGAGARPIITSLEINTNLIWTDNLDGTWSAPSPDWIPRLLRDGVEILRANYDSVSMGVDYTYELLNQPALLVDAFEWLYADSKIWVLKDPTGSTFEFSTQDRTIYVIGVNYYQFGELDIQGGLSASLGFYDSIGSMYHDITLGKYSKQAIFITDSSHVYGWNILGDAFFDFDIEVDMLMYKGYSSRGPGDGALLQDNNSNHIIHNIFLKNWLHLSLAIYAYNTGQESFGHKISNTTLTSPDVAYGGGAGLVGNVHNCEFKYNLWENFSVTNQLCGYDNLYEHNIFKESKNSLIKGDALISDAIGVGGGSSGDSTEVARNVFRLNTIVGSGSYAFRLFSTGSEFQVPLVDNLFELNILVNNGDVTDGVALSVNRNGDSTDWQLNNVVRKNIIFDRNTEFTCLKDDLIPKTVAEFNASSTPGGSAIIEDNLAIDPMLNSDCSLKAGSHAVGYGAMPDNTKSYNIGYTASHSGKLVHRINGGGDSNALAITDTFLDETEFDALVQSPEYFNNIHDGFLASDISVKALVNMTEGVGETVLEKVSNTQLTLNDFDVTKWDNVEVSKSIQKIKLGSLDGMNFSEPNTAQIISPELVAPYTIIIVADGVHTALVVDTNGNATEYNDLIESAGTAIVGDVTLSATSPINWVAVTRITVVEIDNRAYTANEIASNRAKYL